MGTANAFTIPQLLHNDVEFSRPYHTTDVAFFETGPGSLVSGENV
jgi:hypothetical protein